MKKLSDQDLLKLHDLLDSLVENNLPKSKVLELEDWILENEEVRKHYIEFMDMSSSLHHFAEELVGDDIESETDEQSVPLINFIKPIFAIAAFVVLGFFFSNDIDSFFQEIRAGSDSSIDDFSLETSQENEIIIDTVAVLTKSVGIEWDTNADFQPQLGETLEPGLLKISQGLAQVEFIQGATVVLEGPVEFEIINPNEGALAAGKLRAIVPKVATGFTVNVPKGRVIDLGTDFGLHVHDGLSTELFVYDGNVVYEGTLDSGDTITRELKTGDSIFVDPYGFPNWVEMPTEPFISSAELAYRSMEESQKRHGAWLDLSKSISNDPKTLLYFTFDDHSSWSRILKNESSLSSSVQNGAIVGCKWSEGRWPGKGALSFTRKNDRVRLKLPSHLKSASLSAWLKLSSLDQVTAPILCSEIDTIGSTSWSINSDGQLVLQTIGSKGKFSYKSAVAFRRDNLNRWSHVVTTYDIESGIITHYVNGRSFSREKLVENIVLNFPKALIGHASSLDGIRGSLSFKGSIDEFGVFEGVLAESEIRKMYEVGRPFEFPNALSKRLP